MAFMAVVFFAVSFLSSTSSVSGTALWESTSWANAYATFYGGQDASGTMGGACGYGDLYSMGYGTNTAALSNALFNDGLTCGACFLLECITSETKYCYPGKSLTVTATNNCPQGSYGGWCDAPKSHFDLAYPAFAQLAQEVGGVIPVQYKRVPCVKIGGIRFTMQGNQWFDLVLVHNVGGFGDVAAVSIQGAGASPVAMAHNWGQNWSSSTSVGGKALSFAVTLGNSTSLLFANVAGSDWSIGSTYEAASNFY